MRLIPLLRKYYAPSLLVICGIVIGCVVLYLFSSVFIYTHFLFQGFEQNEKQSLTSLFIHKSVFLYPEARIRQLITERVPGIKDIEVQVTLPSTLSVFVQKKTTFAALGTDSGYLMLAQDGEVLQKVSMQPSQLPRITFFQTLHFLDYQQGQKVGFSAIKKALYFIDVVQKNGLTVDSVDIDSVDMIACKTRTVEIDFSQSRDQDSQTHEIVQVLQRLRVGDLKVSKVDLRFNKPVLELYK